MPVHEDGTYTLWDWELRTKDVNWKSKEDKQPIFFFAKIGSPMKPGCRKSGIPEGQFVGYNGKMPYVTKDKAKAYKGTPGA